MNQVSSSYKFSQDFFDFLIKSSEGFLSKEQFDLLIKRFEESASKFFFTSVSEANLLRILSALYDKKSFLIEAAIFDHHIEIISAISSYSNYLTDIIVRNPEYLYLVFDQDFLERDLSIELLKAEIENSVRSFKKIDSKTRQIRNFKRKYLLKIGLADILGFGDLKKTTEELSTLASAVSSILFDVCYAEIQQKYEISLEKHFALCSLGKLGGNELNYSSDIDLILFYEKDFTIDELDKEYHEIISEAIKLFIQTATQITAESYIYRVDFRLRPDGRNSLLARSLNDYMRYYETRGEDWEKQMLIKLGFVCGDEKLFNQFKNFVHGFIYSRSLIGNISEQITKMKSSIEKRADDDQNIKLSSGGIRDIEFSIQALQLINGNKNANLRTGNTLIALSELRKLEMLNEDEYKTLTDSYNTYRKIEHFVQLMNDKQTHSIPESGDVRYKLINFLGYQSTEEFNFALTEMKTKVRAIYNSIMSVSDSTEKDKFHSIEFQDRKRAETNIRFLSKGLSLTGEKQFDAKTVELFQNFKPLLIDYLQHCKFPDLLLENFVRVMKNSKVLSIWYSSFSDELFLKSFLKICKNSQIAVDMMIGQPQLADQILSKKVFQTIELDQQKIPINDILFTLAIQHALQKTWFPEFSKILTNSLAITIEKIVDEFKLDYPFFIAGLGSFGNLEMSFGSDVDLIAVIEKSEDLPKANKDFQNILTELRKNIPQFEIDFRLRPEGKNSPLVTDLIGYKNYVDSRMRIWEFQAFSKCRFICGDEELLGNLISHINSRSSKFDKSEIIRETLTLYHSKLSSGISSSQKLNIKSSSGGLITVDTIVQLLIFLDHQYYSVSQNIDAITKLELVLQNNVSKLPDSFRENYVYLKNVQIALQNQLNQKKSTIPNMDLKIEAIADYIGEPDQQLFVENIKKIFAGNTKLINNLKEQF